jgi:DNA invertase Pin-like site-specific DNA recombinase
MYEQPNRYTSTGGLKPMKIPTQKQLLRLQKIWKTDDMIGLQYGVSGQTVLRWRKKYGIKSLRWFRESRNYSIKKLFQAGLSTRELARKFELSQGTIAKITKSFKTIA